MKTKLLGWALLFLVMGAAIPLSAEQTEADQFNAIKAKAEKGDAEAQYDLGVYYGNGQGVAKDEIEAVNWYRKAAEQNYVEAQYNLGFCYYNGQGVAQDYAEAAKWYRKAAEQNLAAAQNNLGACYLLGRGVANDEVEAVTLIRKAAQQNSRPSWPRGKSRRCRARGMTRAIFKSACRCSRAIRAGRWWMSGAT